MKVGELQIGDLVQLSKTFQGTKVYDYSEYGFYVVLEISEHFTCTVFSQNNSIEDHYHESNLSKVI